MAGQPGAMTTTALLILHEKCNKPTVEKEWIAWHREVHEPDILATGAEHVTFWQLSTKPEPGMPGLGFSHVTIAEYATIDVPPFATALATMRANCLLYTSPSPRDRTRSRMPSSA